MSGSLIGTWPVLFGQAAEMVAIDRSAPTLSFVLISLIGGLAVMLLIGYPIVLGIRSAARQKEMEHLERMRAIELGRPIANELGWWTPARMAVGIGIGVPIGVFAIGTAAAEATGAAPFIWPSAGAVGVAAVICGTVLASRFSMNEANASKGLNVKPYVDPDAYDAAEHQHS
ncbi:hypothetical protein [Tautonia rosea]|uniref:hypothetical protein n=1 Tax=Tautonia rosea TaxID=2728037 RepID=UPI00147665D4|nr:hypothetical protein [Tautonia rosea]